LNPGPPDPQSVSAHGSYNIGFPSNVGSDGRFIGGKVIVLPGEEEFKQWLRKSISPGTLRDYMSYFRKLPKLIPYGKIPGIVKNKYYRVVLNEIAEFLWETGKISWEDKERIKALTRKASGTPRSKKVRNVVVDAEEFLETMKYLRQHNPLAHRIYEIMYFSGCRLEEAAYLLANVKMFFRKLPQREFKALGYIDLGEAVRINIHYNRARKRCEHLWMPKQLFLSLKPISVKPKKISDYVKARGLLRPKLVRKLHYQTLEDLIEDVSLREIMQNRYEKMTVGDTNYSKLILRADKAYTEKILPKLNNNLRR